MTAGSQGNLRGINLNVSVDAHVADVLSTIFGITVEATTAFTNGRYGCDFNIFFS